MKFTRKVKPGRKLRQDPQVRGGSGPPVPTQWDDILATTSYRFWNRELTGKTVADFMDDVSCLTVWEDQALYQETSLTCDADTDEYDNLNRGVWLFAIPNVTVLTAVLHMNVNHAQGDLGGTIGLGKYLGSSYNTSDWVLANWLTDPTLLSDDLIDPGTLSATEWFEFELNAAGIAYCEPETGIKLCTRSSFDLANEEPTTWAAPTTSDVLNIHNHKALPAEYRPYLRIGY